MQILIGLLGLALACSLAAFLVAGIRRHRRMRGLSQQASNWDMRFSEADPFGLTDTYRDLALFSSGHSLCAYNVIYGQSELGRIRLFDLDLELGKGSRRTVRRFQAVLAESSVPLAELVLWRPDLFFPPTVHRPGGRIGQWAFAGDEAASRRLLGRCGQWLAQACCIQSRDNTLVAAMLTAAGAGRAEPDEILRGLRALDVSRTRSSRPDDQNN